jgi:ADP-glucose pyrophosphorylase
MNEFNVINGHKHKTIDPSYNKDGQSKVKNMLVFPTCVSPGNVADGLIGLRRKISSKCKCSHSSLLQNKNNLITQFLSETLAVTLFI